MDKDKLTQKLRKNIKGYVLNIIDEFCYSGKKQTVENCYKYTSEMVEATKEDFIKTLSKEEKELIENNSDNWFDILKSIDIFRAYLINNNIKL